MLVAKLFLSFGNVLPLFFRTKNLSACMKKTRLVLLLACLSCLSSFAQYQEGVIIEPLLKTDTTAIGQKIAYPSFENDEVTICKVIIPPGKSTGWHKHVIPVFAYVLKGTLVVEMENGLNNTFPVNTSFAEIVDTYHNGTNPGQEDVVLIAVYLGGKGQQLSIKKSLTM